MAKRVADTYLTDRNFDDDDAAEEAGTFVTASKDVLSTRDIKKARRKGVGSEHNSSSSTSAFKGFTGFTGFGSASTGFNFGSGSLTAVGSKLSTSVPGLTTVSVPTCSSVMSTNSRSSGFGFGFTVRSAPTDNGTAQTGSAKSIASNSSADIQAKDDLPAAYIQKLKCLNESLLRWIDQHVRSNPCCILTPVFRDYDKHVDVLNKMFNVRPDQLSSSSQTDRSHGSPAANTSSIVRNVADKCATSSSSSSVVTPSSAVVPLLSSTLPATFNSSAAYASPGFFTTSASGSSTPATQQYSLFSFSASSSSTVAPTTATLGGSTFPSGFSTNTVSGFPFGTSGFKFGSSTTQPSVAATDNQTTAGSTNAAEDDEEYVPPKPESVEIKEDDAFYTVRCKLFYMLNNEWKERGVGLLYLKPCSGDKTQLLIRSDTTLGNILLNISLTKSIPTNLQGKTNVSLSCVPNPPIDSKQDNTKPVCMLIRVKTADDAKELLKQLSDNKK